MERTVLAIHQQYLPVWAWPDPQKPPYVSVVRSTNTSLCECGQIHQSAHPPPRHLHMQQKKPSLGHPSHQGPLPHPRKFSGIWGDGRGGGATKLLQSLAQVSVSQLPQTLMTQSLPSMPLLGKHAAETSSQGTLNKMRVVYTVPASLISPSQFVLFG